MDTHHAKKKKLKLLEANYVGCAACCSVTDARQESLKKFLNNSIENQCKRILSIN